MTQNNTFSRSERSGTSRRPYVKLARVLNDSFNLMWVNDGKLNYYESQPSLQVCHVMVTSIMINESNVLMIGSTKRKGNE
jgi:hypothetical protein